MRQCTDDSKINIACIGYIFLLQNSIRQGMTSRRPGIGERTLYSRYSGTLNLNAGIPPGLDIAIGITDPALSDAQTGDEGYPAIYGNHLSMVPREPGKRAVKLWPVETSDFDSSGSEPLKEATRRVAERPKPVVDQPDFDTVAGLGGQQVRKLMTCIVFMDDEGLEMDILLGRLYGVDPGRIVFSGILKKAHIVTANTIGTRSPCNRRVGEISEWRAGFSL
jgi:hypothetical protein